MGARWLIGGMCGRGGVGGGVGGGGRSLVGRRHVRQHLLVFGLRGGEGCRVLVVGGGCVGLTRIVVVWFEGGDLLIVLGVDIDVGLRAGLLVVVGGVVGSVGGGGCGGWWCGCCGHVCGVGGQLLFVWHLLKLQLWLRPEGYALFNWHLGIEVVAWWLVLCLGWWGQLDRLVGRLVGGCGSGGVDYGWGLVGLVGLRL